MSTLRAWYCRHFHRRIVNLNSQTYECAECFRLIHHGLSAGYRQFPMAAPETTESDIEQARRAA